MSFCKFSEFMFRNNLHCQLVSKVGIASTTDSYSEDDNTSELGCFDRNVITRKSKPPLYHSVLSAVKIIHQFVKDFKGKIRTRFMQSISPVDWRSTNPLQIPAMVFVLLNSRIMMVMFCVSGNRFEGYAMKKGNIVFRFLVL